MTEKIIDGKYVLNNIGDKLIMVEYIDEVLQGIKSLLIARRGSFYPNKDFGSLISVCEHKEPVEEYALAYARQAVDRLDGVYVKSASKDDENIVFVVEVNNEERLVKVNLEKNV